MQFGWWRIIDPEDLKALLKVLHLRGIREKALQKQIQKHLDYITQACIKNKDGMYLKEISALLLTYEDFTNSFTLGYILVCLNLLLKGIFFFLFYSTNSNYLHSLKWYYLQFFTTCRHIVLFLKKEYSCF